MLTIKLEEAVIPGAVLSRKVDDSGTAVVTLSVNIDEGVWYDVQEWMDGDHWATAYSSLEEAIAEYKSSVRYYQIQAEYFED